MTTLNLLETLEITSCPSCGVNFAMPVTMLNNKRRTGTDFWCPNGHSLSYSETEAERLKKEVARLERTAANLRESNRIAYAEAETERKSHAATKGQLTKMRKRAAATVCPVCPRSIATAQMQRHIKTKHPDFTP